MWENKTINTSDRPGGWYLTGKSSDPALAAQPRGVEVRASAVPAGYARKAALFDRRYCGTQLGQVGPLEAHLASLPQVKAIVFGGYGEASAGTRALIKDLARETALRRERREGFNCSDVGQATGVVAWWITRRWGRLAVRSAAQVKDNALQQVRGSPPALREARARAPPPRGAEDAFWTHRRTACDQGDYSGRAFGGFSSWS